MVHPLPCSNLRLWDALPSSEFDLTAFNAGDYTKVGTLCSGAGGAGHKRCSACRPAHRSLDQAAHLGAAGAVAHGHPAAACPVCASFNPFDTDLPCAALPAPLAQAVEQKRRADDITAVLYPNDATEEGKELRLKQQFFFVSASLQDTIARYLVRAAAPAGAEGGGPAGIGALGASLARRAGTLGACATSPPWLPPGQRPRWTSRGWPQQAPQPAALDLFPSFPPQNGTPSRRRSTTTSRASPTRRASR
jgi:hypothetical protein